MGYLRRIQRAADWSAALRTPRNKRQDPGPEEAAGPKLEKGRGLARRRPRRTNWGGLILLGLVSVAGGIAYFLFYLWLITP